MRRCRGSSRSRRRPRHARRPKRRAPAARSLRATSSTAALRWRRAARSRPSPGCDAAPIAPPPVARGRTGAVAPSTAPRTRPRGTVPAAGCRGCPVDSLRFPACAYAEASVRPPGTLPSVDLTLSPSEEAFRDELRSWLEANHPGTPPSDERRSFEFRRSWQRRLHEAGWAGIAWPESYGGRGASLIEQAIFNEEIIRARTPQVANVLGLAMGGPTVIAHGTEEQRQRYLPPILSADEIWCQGFS